MTMRAANSAPAAGPRLGAPYLPGFGRCGIPLREAGRAQHDDGRSAGFQPSEPATGTIRPSGPALRPGDNAAPQTAGHLSTTADALPGLPQKSACEYTPTDRSRSGPEERPGELALNDAARDRRTEPRFRGPIWAFAAGTTLDE